MTIRTTNKQEATRLRKGGLSYPEIAERIDCSVSWCTKHLKDVVVEGEPIPSYRETKTLVINILEEALSKIRAL